MHSASHERICPHRPAKSLSAPRKNRARSSGAPTDAVQADSFGNQGADRPWQAPNDFAINTEIPKEFVDGSGQAVRFLPQGSPYTDPELLNALQNGKLGSSS